MQDNGILVHEAFAEFSLYISIEHTIICSACYLKLSVQSLIKN